MQNPFYRKEFLPGYTGHVPHKNDLFGVTEGDANKILISPKGKDKFFSGTCTSSLVQRPTNKLTKADPRLKTIQHQKRKAKTNRNKRNSS